MVDVFELFIPVLYRCSASIVAVQTYCTGYFSRGTEKVSGIFIYPANTDVFPVVDRFSVPGGRRVGELPYKLSDRDACLA